MNDLSNIPDVDRAQSLEDVFDRLHHMQIAVGHISSVVNALVDDVSALMEKVPAPEEAPMIDVPEGLTEAELMQAICNEVFARNRDNLFHGFIGVIEGFVYIVPPVRPEMTDIPALLEADKLVTMQMHTALVRGLITETTYKALKNIESGDASAGEVQLLWDALDAPTTKAALESYWTRDKNSDNLDVFAVAADNPDEIEKVIVTYAIGMYGNLSVQALHAYLIDAATKG